MKTRHYDGSEVMIALGEVARRVTGRVTGRLQSLPVLTLSVHSACNCRCVMCDIWRANEEKREISDAELAAHIDAIRRLRVQRVMLTGGEPLLHRNLWALCDRLRAEHIRITLVTTGLLLDVHARAAARAIDEVVVSIDGAPEIHDAIRRVPGGFRRLSRGVRLLKEHASGITVIARCVVQKANYADIAATIDGVLGVPVDRLSFLAADVSSAAFNRPQPWPESRQVEVLLDANDVERFADVIRALERTRVEALTGGFVAGGAAGLWRIHQYYAALNGAGEFPPVRCNTPWISAVLEPGNTLRPCFFHEAYPAVAGASLDEAINSAGAVEFRRRLDVRRDETCRRCVCSLSLPLAARA